MTLGSFKASADYNDEQSYTHYLNKHKRADSLGRFYLNAGFAWEVIRTNRCQEEGRNALQTRLTLRCLPTPDIIEQSSLSESTINGVVIGTEKKPVGSSQLSTVNSQLNR